MAEEGSMADNMAKGRGVFNTEDGKGHFNIVGASKSDRDHPDFRGDPQRQRGRPPKDQNFRTVGRQSDDEQGAT